MTSNSFHGRAILGYLTENDVADDLE